jgi:predicted ribosome-associated RNA-binding protein Tma20
MKKFVFLTILFSNYCFGQESTLKKQENAEIIEVYSSSNTNVEDQNNLKNELNSGGSEMKIYPAEVQFIYFQNAEIVIPTVINSTELIKK